MAPVPPMLNGHCTCGEVRYRLLKRPLFVHCCHCTWCQRETGSAFAVNAIIEAAEMQIWGAAPVDCPVPSASGKGQRIFRCGSCDVAVWSVYSGIGPRIRFVRVGTLDDPAACPPDIHIYTGSRLPWVALPEGVPAMPEYYRRSAMWPQESVARWHAARG